ncbi:MAG: hypothetical protein M1827_005314 [Pycnora praestabilis]|nr:MAG: hypothetical protein M1827_005314 [Pycnora praestabilis]
MSSQPLPRPGDAAGSQRSVSFSSATSLSGPSAQLSSSSSLSYGNISSPTSHAEVMDKSQSVVRWTPALEARLQYAEAELKKHQKKWSAGQEIYYEEVETLQALKRKYNKFLRRRNKDHASEGRRFSKANDLLLASPDSSEEEEEQNSPGNQSAVSPSCSFYPSTAQTDNLT